MTGVQTCASSDLHGRPRPYPRTARQGHRGGVGRIPRPPRSRTGQGTAAARQECDSTTEDEHLENEHIHYICDAPLEIAVRASMSFPAIYTTCTYDKYNFIDGGSKDNLPVKILRDMGVGKVLAIGFDIMNYDPDAGLDGLIKVIWRALDVYSIDGTRKSMEMADLAVQINNENTQLFSMDNVDETIQEGYDAIMAHKEEILRIFKD